MPLCSWEKTLTCPYNPSHQITIDRIQTHLVKCRRNHPEADLVVCPYNASHHVPRPEEQFHVTSCPDRKVVELAKYSWALDRPGQHGHVTMPAPVTRNPEAAALMTQDENWETEATVRESYDPQAKCAKARVVRRLQGATPSERKKFYASERQRHELIKSKEEEEDRAAVKKVEEETNPESIFTPRPSVARPDFTHNDAMRRPAIGARSERSSISARPGSVTSQLLAIINDGKARRPGSIFSANKEADVSAANTSRDTSAADTTKDTLNVTGNTSMEENLEVKFNKLVLGKGRGIDMKTLEPLRRPSGLANFVKN